MDEQLEEGDVLGPEGWNGDYDIAEEEEERLLEDEQEVIGSKHEYGYDADQNYVTTEYETTEGEEDILDLGLSDDIIEYEEQTGDYRQFQTEQDKSAKSTSEDNKSQELSDQKNNFAKDPQVVGKSETQILNDTKEVQQVIPQKTFVQPPNKCAPVRSAPPLMRNNTFGRPVRRPPFGMPSARPMLGGQPSLMELNSVPEMFFKNSIGDPLFAGGHSMYPGSNMTNEQFLSNQAKFLEQERNNTKRFFINPHYQGSVTVQGHHPRITPTTELGPCFVQTNKLPPHKMFSGRGQSMDGPRNNLIRPRDVSLPNVRFPPPMNIPPPLLNPPVIENQHSRFSANPPQLMDVIVPSPFRNVREPPFFSEPPPGPPRFRLGFQPDSSSQMFESAVRFLGPPISGVKRLLQPGVFPSVPVKQPRMMPPPSDRESFRKVAPVQATVPRPALAPRQIISRPIRPTAPPVRTVVPRSALSAEATIVKQKVEPITTPAIAATAAVSPTPVTPPCTSSVVHKNAEQDESSDEMKEYLRKVEEQRKKREEILKMKEERRRQNLAAASNAASQLSLPTTTATTGPTSSSSNCGQAIESVGVKSNPIPVLQVDHRPGTLDRSVQLQPPLLPESKSGFPITSSVKGKFPSRTVVSDLISSGRKTLLVKPTPTQGNANLVPPIATAVRRRFKVIIVKNKNGDIIEKKRVPIDEPATSASNDANNVRKVFTRNVTPIVHRPPVVSVRISETVAIENLNPTCSEDDVKNMCEMFGPVQEIYPKLQDGKAIVRFTSVNAANNFVYNHNTPGICVSFL